jgi:hypothetical protein
MTSTGMSGPTAAATSPTVMDGSGTRMPKPFFSSIMTGSVMAVGSFRSQSALTSGPFILRKGEARMGLERRTLAHRLGSASRPWSRLA